MLPVPDYQGSISEPVFVAALPSGLALPTSMRASGASWDCHSSQPTTWAMPCTGGNGAVSSVWLPTGSLSHCLDKIVNSMPS